MSRHITFHSPTRENRDARMTIFSYWFQMNRLKLLTRFRFYFLVAAFLSGMRIYRFSIHTFWWKDEKEDIYSVKYIRTRSFTSIFGWRIHCFSGFAIACLYPSKIHSSDTRQSQKRHRWKEKENQSKLFQRLINGQNEWFYHFYMIFIIHKSLVFCATHLRKFSSKFSIAWDFHLLSSRVHTPT